jgi:hypothetical protein
MIAVSNALRLWLYAFSLGNGEEACYRHPKTANKRCNCTHSSTDPAARKCASSKLPRKSKRSVLQKCSVVVSK